MRSLEKEAEYRQCRVSYRELYKDCRVVCRELYKDIRARIKVQEAESEIEIYEQC